MEAWYYEDPTRFDTQERFIENRTNNRDLARMWSLYRYLERYPPTSADDLRSRVFLDKQRTPIFDEKTSEEVFRVWKTLKDPQQFVKLVTEKYERLASQAGGGDEPVNEEFLDRLFLKVYYLLRSPLVGLIQSIGFDANQETTLGYTTRVFINVANLLTKIVFFLHTIEATPELGGPLLTIALDSINKNFPRILSFVQPLLAEAAVAGTVATAGLGGIPVVAAYLVFALVVLTQALMNLSRGKFGSVFTTFLLLIPVAGPPIAQAIHSIEEMYGQFREKQKKFARVPFIGETLATFDPLAVEGGFRRTYRRKINGRRKTSRKSKAVDRARRRGAAYSEPPQGDSQ